MNGRECPICNFISEHYRFISKSLQLIGNVYYNHPRCYKLSPDCELAYDIDLEYW